jgi:GNAT superfamily N-acetyltransferase
VDIRLRPAERNDDEFIFRVSREALREYVDEIWGWRDKEQRRLQQKWLARTRVQIIELEREQERIGCLAIEECCDHVFVNRIALLPSWQGRGIGKR